MKLLQTRALVLFSRPMGEGDRLLTLFTLERGKLTAKAPGARKVKSKLAAVAELFTCSSLQLFGGRSMATVTQGRVETSFSGIREDIKSYALGMYFGELVEKLVEEGEAEPELFALLYQSFDLLHHGRVDSDLLQCYFQLKLLSLSGYTPHFKNCLCCRGTAPPFFWTVGEGGLFCVNCRSEIRGPLFSFSGGTHALTRGLLEFAPGKIGNLKATPRQKKELLDFLKHFLQYWTEVGPFKTLVYLEKIKAASLRK